MTKPRIIFLVGPTAAGKSEIAVSLTEDIGAEIISCDSMQIYKKMNIITSRPSPRLLKRVKHHLVGIIEPSKEYNVCRYRKEALTAIKKIIEKNKVPLLVGGTGLYMSVLIDGLFPGAAKDAAIRAKLYKLLREKGSAYLFGRLKAVDPEAAFKIHPHDARRIIRALEVYESTGKKISELQKTRKGLSDKYEIRIFCLDIARPRLYKRIDTRVDAMFKQGLIPEVRRLIKIRLSKTASGAIGLREIKGYLEGAYGLGEAKRLIRRNTRWYAKRQLTWFRKDKRIQWVKVGDKESPNQVAQRIFAKIKRDWSRQGV